jgi:hypothetical protein
MGKENVKISDTGVRCRESINELLMFIDRQIVAKNRIDVFDWYLFKQEIISANR